MTCDGLFLGLLICFMIVAFVIEGAAYFSESLWHEPESGKCSDCRYMTGNHKHYFSYLIGPPILVFRCDICHELNKIETIKQEDDYFKRCKKKYNINVSKLKKLKGLSNENKKDNE